MSSKTALCITGINEPSVSRGMSASADIAYDIGNIGNIGDIGSLASAVPGGGCSIY